MPVVCFCGFLFVCEGFLFVLFFILNTLELIFQWKSTDANKHN